MFRLIKVILLILFLLFIGWYVWNKIFNATIPDTQAIQDKVAETVEAIPTVVNGNSNWSIGQVLDVRVEDFLVQALVVDQSGEKWYVVDSADLDLWRCESTDTDTCQPTKVNCADVVSFEKLKLDTELYKECY